jgi:hypothetical protein
VHAQFSGHRATRTPSWSLPRTYNRYSFTFKKEIRGYLETLDTTHNSHVTTTSHLAYFRQCRLPCEVCGLALASCFVYEKKGRVSSHCASAGHCIIQLISLHSGYHFFSFFFRHFVTGNSLPTRTTPLANSLSRNPFGSPHEERRVPLSFNMYCPSETSPKRVRRDARPRARAMTPPYPP